MDKRNKLWRREQQNRVFKARMVYHAACGCGIKKADGNWTHSKTEIAEYCGYKNTKGFTTRYLKPLLESGLLQMTIPGKPNSRSQKYVAVDTAQEKQP